MMETVYVAKKVDKLAPREGRRGTGVRLRQSCGFCKRRFRTVLQRTKHANACPKD
jgi:hypothetical protein